MIIRNACLALALGLSGAVAAAPALAQPPQELRAQAEAGDAHAAYEYGYALTFPFEGEADYAAGRNWLERAAQAGESEAVYALGLIYRDGVGVAADLNRARTYFQGGWSAGFAPAGLALAELDLYAFGQARPEALQVLDALSNDENLGPRARLSLAEALFFGVAGAPDAARAVGLAQSAVAADPNLAQAYYMLGVAAMEGAGRVADPAEARALWLRGAQGGDTLAMMALGDAHALGRGGAVDMVEARALFGAAAAIGEPGAAEAVAAIDEELTPQQRAQAEQRQAALLGALS
jgi:hypothetical protein